MQKRFRQVFTSVKEHTSFSCAKIATVGGFSDLDLIVVKASSPEDVPLPDRYVHELLKIFSISPPSSFRAFSQSFTRRFGKTQCWRVALKCLVLLHRLLRSLPENSPFRSELRWARSNGLLSLHPCHFRDCSSSAAGDYTMFVSSYAQLLDEAIDHLSFESKEIEEQDPEDFPDRKKDLDRIIEVLAQLQCLIDRVMDCQPTGPAARSFVVQSAMRHIIRDSFIWYTTFRKEIVLVLENLIQLPYRNCVAAFGIYKKAALQADELGEFYDWCKSMGLCGSYEYPLIDRVPEMQIRALADFLNGMWQLTDSSSSSTTSPLTSTMLSPISLTEHDSHKQPVTSEKIRALGDFFNGMWQITDSSSSSTTSPLTSTILSPLSLTEDGEDKQPVISEKVESTNLLKSEEHAENKKVDKVGDMEPLIQFEVDSNVSWEALLEASISPSSMAPKNNLFPRYPNVHGYGNYSADGPKDEVNQWQMQIYNPYTLHPFYQQYNMPHYYGSVPSNPTYPWGL
ncbi:unnamed protein product [Ilex paraguariensis]|uniref:ENTH domain-containing protein n=1 Tax=Ilex paraguariensis TaxID=185542 RepID=A0ABC8TZ52_9AQUA